MGKHEAKGDASDHPGRRPARHASDVDSPTVPMRADFDEQGNLKGFSVGREPRLAQDTYNRDTE